MSENPRDTSGDSSEAKQKAVGDSSRQADPTVKQWRVVAMLDTGRPKHLGGTYRREKAETLRDAHQSALNGDETSHVRPPENTDVIRIMTIEEHEAQRLSWKLNRDSSPVESGGEDSGNA